MLIHIGFDLQFELPGPASILLMLYTHPEQARFLRQPEHLVIQPSVPVFSFIDWFGNRAARIQVPAGPLKIYYDNVIQNSGLPEPRIDGARLHPVEELPVECLQFLLASRYCEVERLSQAAWDLFGQTPFSWQRVQAVMDWVFNNIQFGYQFARPTKTAYDVFVERNGVCRDFMHLAVTLLRALNIPARYATGYLGDIGVPISPTPMDFAACMEVYLGNRWWVMDPRHNEPRIGRILQARGRDAIDVALTTSFGPSTLQKFVVWTDEIR